MCVDENASLRAQNWYNVEVNVRNLSTAGFMAECAESVRIGSYVSLEVPGIDPKDIELTIDNNVLRITGEKRSVRNDEEGGAAPRGTRYFHVPAAAATSANPPAAATTSQLD